MMQDFPDPIHPPAGAFWGFGEPFRYTLHEYVVSGDGLALLH